MFETYQKAIKKLMECMQFWIKKETPISICTGYSQNTM